MKKKKKWKKSEKRKKWTEWKSWAKWKIREKLKKNKEWLAGRRCRCEIFENVHIFLPQARNFTSISKRLLLLLQTNRRKHLRFPAFPQPTTRWHQKYDLLPKKSHNNNRHPIWERSAFFQVEVSCMSLGREKHGFYRWKLTIVFLLRSACLTIVTLCKNTYCSTTTNNPIQGHSVFFRDGALAPRRASTPLNHVLSLVDGPIQTTAIPPDVVRTPRLHGAPAAGETSGVKLDYWC